MITEIDSGDNSDTWIVMPHPGYVIKFKDVDLEGEKVKCFVNVCHCKELPPPVQDLDEDQLAAQLDAGDLSFRVPLSVGELDCVRDNNGNNAVKFDVLVNSIFYEKRLSSPSAQFFRHFFCMVLCEAINNKHKVELDPNANTILRNRKKMGDIEPQRILKKARGAPVIQEVEPVQSTSEPSAGIEEQYDYPELDQYAPPKGLSMRILRGKTLEMKMELPSEECIKDGNRVRLQLSSERCLVTLDNTCSLFDFCFPFMIDAKSAQSRLNIEAQSLTDMLRLSGLLWKYATEEVTSATVPEFSRVLGASQVKSSEAFRNQYAKDEGHFSPRLPDVVLSPRSVEEVSAVLRICNEKRIPVVPFGTGTGLEGGSIPIYGGVSLNLMEMSDIKEVNVEDSDCAVQPGVTRLQLNKAIRDTGLFFPVDPGADASLCGMAATGASGTNAIRYKTMKENVLGMQVVLADGSVLHTRGEDRRPRKTAAGLNLTDLFVGSEGILGVITEVRLRLHARPPALSAAVCSFPNVTDAINSVVQILQYSIPIARIEFLDSAQVSACNSYSKLSLDEVPTLFLEFHGSSDSEVTAQAEMCEEICQSNSGSNFTFATEQSERERLWTARHNAYYAALSLRKGATGFCTDVCIPISRLAEVVDETRKDLDEHGITGTVVGHVGDGNFHVVLPVFEENSDEMAHIWKFSDRLVKRALAAHGTCTGEHGIGMGKMKYLQEEIGPVGIEVMRAIKRTLDPNEILNPGKVI